MSKILLEVKNHWIPHGIHVTIRTLQRVKRINTSRVRWVKRKWNGNWWVQSKHASHDLFGRTWLILCDFHFFDVFWLQTGKRCFKGCWLKILFCCNLMMPPELILSLLVSPLFMICVEEPIPQEKHAEIMKAPMMKINSNAWQFQKPS